MTLDNAAETLLELQHSGGCQAVYHAISEDDVERILKYPFTMVASDGEIPQFGVGAPHPRSYGTFARILARYVRERHVITLEDAVHKMSGLPAQRLKLYDRGLLGPGMKATSPSSIPTVADLATLRKTPSIRDRLQTGVGKWQAPDRGRRAYIRTLWPDLVWSGEAVRLFQFDDNRVSSLDGAP